MTGAKHPKKVGRGYERDLDAGPFGPMTDSFDLIPAGLWDWSEVKARHVQQWITTLLADYSDSYANNQFRALQQFFKWYATEDPDEPRPNAMANLRPPQDRGQAGTYHLR
jgi:site-specific recombinase XerD